MHLRAGSFSFLIIRAVWEAIGNLEAFLSSSQRQVTGDTRLTLRPRSFSVDGVRSPHALMTPAASYGEGSRLWTGEEAAGFAKIYGISQMLAAKAGGAS